MDTQEFEAWVGDLGSGKFPKGSYALRSKDPDTGEEKFCCLGVLCERARAAGIVERTGRTVGDNGQVKYGYRAKGSDHTPEYNILPPVVRDWAGLWACNPDGVAVVNDQKDSFEPVIERLREKFTDEHSDLRPDLRPDLAPR